MIRSIVNPGVLATTSDFARVPGSGEVMEATVAGGTTPGTWVPLHDASGSTIALVDPSSGAINTQYSYDPSGMVGTIGAANSYPFLYAGMEYDGATGLYHTGSNYYSLQLTRPASEVGPMPSHTSGNPTSPSDIAGFSGGGGSNPFSPTRNLQNAGIAIGAGVGAAALTAGGLAVLGLSESLGWIAGPVGGAVALAVDLALFFDDLFGGSPDIPRELLHPAHSPQGLDLVGVRALVTQESVDPQDRDDFDLTPAVPPAGITFGGVLAAAGAEELIGGGPEDPVADVLSVATIIGGGIYVLAKGGSQNLRDSEFAGLSDAEVSRRARDESLPPSERLRYQREEKARGLRNKQKRR